MKSLMLFMNDKANMLFIYVNILVMNNKHEYITYEYHLCYS